MDTTEIWKPVQGYEGYYSVSSLGRVRREYTVTSARAGHVLAPSDRGNGYLFVQLCKGGTRLNESVHRLVAAAFLGPCPPGHEVNHRSGIKTDNSPANLEYVTSSANQLHAFRSGLQSCEGERNGQAKLTEAMVREIRSSYTGARGQKIALARRYGVSDAAVRDILARRTWPDVA